jgi:hypothetical protein
VIEPMKPIPRQNVGPVSTSLTKCAPGSSDASTAVARDRALITADDRLIGALAGSP